MKTITKKYLVFLFDELSELSKSKAINECIHFFIECVPYEKMSLDMKKACDTAEEMQTPWFVGSYVWEYAKNEIEENCRLNSYLIDGSLFHQK